MPLPRRRDACRSQACFSLCPFCVYSCATLEDRPLHWVPPSVPRPFMSRRAQDTPLPPLTLRVLSRKCTESGFQTHSTSFPSHHLLITHNRPPRRMRARARTQFMAHVLVLSHPPGARKPEYALVEQWPCARDRQASGKGKSHARNNSGSN